MDNKIIAIVLAVVITLVAFGTMFSMADPKGVNDDSSKGTWQRQSGNSLFTPLQNKDTNWQVIEDDGIYGWIHTTGAKKATGDLGGNIEIRQLSSDTWYMVSLEHRDDGHAGPHTSFNPDDGLFGGSTGDWTELAFFKTDSNGNGGATFPYDPSDDGLKSDNNAAAGVNGNIPGMNMNPTISSGNYENIHVTLKNVGSSADGTTPDMGKLIIGGSAELFEMQTIHFKVK